MTFLNSLFQGSFSYHLTTKKKKHKTKLCQGCVPSCCSYTFLASSLFSFPFPTSIAQVTPPPISNIQTNHFKYPGFWVSLLFWSDGYGSTTWLKSCKTVVYFYNFWWPDKLLFLELERKKFLNHSHKLVEIEILVLSQFTERCVFPSAIRKKYKRPRIFHWISPIF